MTRDEAAVCWARLVAHWPRLGGPPSDPLATSRAGDWITSVTKLTAETGMAAVSEVIETHREYRLPVFADVQDAARTIAARHALERSTEDRKALEAAAPDPSDRAKVAAILDDARRALTNRPKATETPTRVSKYDDTPRAAIFWGEQRLTPEERQAELETFADRHVRAKRAER